MKIIDNKLLPNENCYIKEVNDIGKIIENAEYISPTVYDIIYLGKQVTDLKDIEEIYEDISYEAYGRSREIFSEEINRRLNEEINEEESLEEE